MAKNNKKAKNNLKEYLPIVAILVGVALFVGAVVLFTTEKEVVYTDATVYFLDSTNQFAPETVKVDVEEVEKGVVKALINGPMNMDLRKSVNGEVKILSVKNETGLCTVDLSEEFAISNSNDATREANAVYAIANSLGKLPTVREVKINIEGDEAYNLGHISLANTFVPEWNMVRFEDRPQG